jgi:hypothetical protein
MIVHLVDSTCELFGHFYGLRRFNKGKDRAYGAIVINNHANGGVGAGEGWQNR